MTYLESLLVEIKLTSCPKCKGKVFLLGNGKYECKYCEKEVLDDLGKVKKYLSENGSAPAEYISQMTEVDIEIVKAILEGTLELSSKSPYYRSCEKCGCSIRKGNFCPSCTYEITNGIKTLIDEDKKVDKKFVNPEMVGKMHVSLDRRR